MQTLTMVRSISLLPAVLTLMVHPAGMLMKVWPITVLLVVGMRMTPTPLGKSVKKMMP